MADHCSWWTLHVIFDIKWTQWMFCTLKAHMYLVILRGRQLVKILLHLFINASSWLCCSCILTNQQLGHQWKQSLMDAVVSRSFPVLPGLDVVCLAGEGQEATLSRYSRSTVLCEIFKRTFKFMGFPTWEVFHIFYPLLPLQGTFYLWHSHIQRNSK